MALNRYIQQVQRLLHDTTQARFNPTDLKHYINVARGQVAAEGQCVRVLSPTSGPVSTISVTSGGTGWGAAQVIIATPDSPSGLLPFPNGSQATATATTGSGQITAITLNSAGAGYFQPSISFSGAGQGTVAVATVSGINQTTVGQEVYPFSSVNPMVAVSGSGVGSIYFVNSISLIWGTFRYSLMAFSFSKYQAFVRTYTAGYQYIPAVFSQFGQGEFGSIYLYPIPNAPYQMEWDCCAVPLDLDSDTDIEAIPPPWVDAVPYYAAYLAELEGQQPEKADYFWKEYKKFMVRARQMSQPRRVINFYGRA